MESAMSFLLATKLAGTVCGMTNRMASSCKKVSV